MSGHRVPCREDKLPLGGGGHRGSILTRDGQGRLGFIVEGCTCHFCLVGGGELLVFEQQCCGPGCEPVGVWRAVGRLLPPPRQAI